MSGGRHPAVIARFLANDAEPSDQAAGAGRDTPELLVLL
jgi:hypothetical protein